MSRKTRTVADIQEKFSEQGDGQRSRRRKLRGERNGMQFLEVLSLVCKYHCQGQPAAEIRRTMKEVHGIVMSREEPYAFVGYAAMRKWIKYVPPLDYVLKQQIKDKYDWLEAVEIVHTAVFEDVACRGAEMLLDLVKKSPKKQELHIGIAGGHAMRKLAVAFAQLLRQPTQGLPETLVFHAMVAAFNVFEPACTPDGIFSLFEDDPAIRVKTKFVSLHAPAVVRAREYKGLRRAEGVSEAFKAAGRLDIIVTSASLWSDPDNELHKHMRTFPKALDAVTEAGCVADMLWGPLGPNGPIHVETDVRPMALLDLDDLARRVENGTQVLLAIGPCQACGRPKTEALAAILSAQPRIITRMVADTLSARPLCPNQAS